MNENRSDNVAETKAFTTLTYYGHLFLFGCSFFTFTKTCTFLFVIQKLLHINFFYIDCKQSKFLYKIKDNLVTIV